MPLVQVVTRVSYISKSTVILRRDTIVDLPDGFNSRIAQFRMEIQERKRAAIDSFPTRPSIRSMKLSLALRQRR